jgi:hypothetical protein
MIQDTSEFGTKIKNTLYDSRQAVRVVVHVVQYSSTAVWSIYDLTAMDPLTLGLYATVLYWQSLVQVRSRKTTHTAPLPW